MERRCVLVPAGTLVLVRVLCRPHGTAAWGIEGEWDVTDQFRSLCPKPVPTDETTEKEETNG